MGIDPHARKRKLRHIGSANDRSACSFQAGHCRAVCSGRFSPLQNQRSRGGNLTAYVVKIFDGYGKPRQRPTAVIWICGREASLIEHSGQEHIFANVGYRHCDALFHFLTGIGLLTLDPDSGITKAGAHRVG